MGILLAGCSLAAPMDRLERRRLVAHLEMTGSWLAGEVSGLSEAQLRFRPAPGAWSILENVEHLVVCEPIYWQDLRKAMEAPPARGRQRKPDDGVLWYGIDRTQRQTALAAESSKGQLRNLQTGMESFGKLRAKMLEYARTTSDDLRGHLVEREQCDAYQWLLLISTHAQRHILQIREIKAHRDYPRQ
jgi:hypothetical protein